MTPRIFVLEVSNPDETNERPIAWVLVEREEKYEYFSGGTDIYAASIEFSCVRMTSCYDMGPSQTTTFAGSYHSGFGSPSVSLTSPTMGAGAVFLDLQGLKGHRIGTYLMNEIVSWVQQWPDATVRSIELLDGQAYDTNKERRNRFYTRFGLEFDFKDSDRREGSSRPMAARNLQHVETWKQNLRVLRADEFCGSLINEKKQLESELERHKSGIKDLLAERRSAERHPVRWALRQLWWKHGSLVLIWGAIAGFGLLFWWEHQ